MFSGQLQNGLDQRNARIRQGFHFGWASARKYAPEMISATNPARTIFDITTSRITATQKDNVMLMAERRFVGSKSASYNP